MRSYHSTSSRHASLVNVLVLFQASIEGMMLPRDGTHYNGPLNECHGFAYGLLYVVFLSLYSEKYYQDLLVP